MEVIVLNELHHGVYAYSCTFEICSLPCIYKQMRAKHFVLIVILYSCCIINLLNESSQTSEKEELYLEKYDTCCTGSCFSNTMLAINVNNHHSTGAASGGERHSCAEFCPRPDSLWSQMDSGADSLAVKISRMA